MRNHNKHSEKNTQKNTQKKTAEPWNSNNSEITTIAINNMTGKHIEPPNMQVFSTMVSNLGDGNSSSLQTRNK